MLNTQLPGFDTYTTLLKTTAVNGLMATQIFALVPMAAHVQDVLANVQLETAGPELIDKIADFQLRPTNKAIAKLEVASLKQYPLCLRVVRNALPSGQVCIRMFSRTYVRSCRSAKSLLRVLNLAQRITNGLALAFAWLNARDESVAIFQEHGSYT